MLTSVSVICSECSTKNLLKSWVEIDSFVSDDRAMGQEVEHIMEISKECSKCSTTRSIQATGSEYPHGSGVDEWDFEYENCQHE